MALFTNILQKFGFGDKPQSSTSVKGFQNAFAKAFYQITGAGYTTYDDEADTYLDEGYNVNSIVYSIIQQMATKTMAVPYEVKTVKNAKAAKALKKNFKGYDYGRNPELYMKKKRLEKDAFEEIIKDMPLERPNPLQSWEEMFALYKTFIRLTGNAYFYIPMPEEGVNKGVPMHVYVLPSHQMSIVLKKDVDLMTETESPIDYYMLIDGDAYAKFYQNEVIHVKLPNPNYDENGSHLYGQSPLKAVRDNMQSSNEAMANNIKTLKNGGAFGLIFGKGEGLRQEQVDSLKERLVEMDKGDQRLSKLAGISHEVGFQRISLTTEELKPFDYLNYDQKQICNALGWSDKLLNNDDGAKYDNVNSFRKQVITDNIIPDLELLAHALNTQFLPLFKGYEGSEINFDASQLPEMQQDTEKLVNWLANALDRGVISRREFREAIGFPDTDLKEMEVHTVSMSVIPLEMALAEPDAGEDADPPKEEEEEEETEEEKEAAESEKKMARIIEMIEKFDPNQPRDKDGKWTAAPWYGVDTSKVLDAHNKFGGSTFDLRTGEDLIGTRSYSVSTHLQQGAIVEGELTKDILEEYINRHKDLLEANDALQVGTWFNTDNGKTYLDIVTVLDDRQRAIELGRQFNQIAIFDLWEVDEIPTGGSGEKEAAE